MTPPTTLTRERLAPASATASQEPHHDLVCSACAVTLTHRHRMAWVTNDGRVWCSSCVSAPAVLPPTHSRGREQLSQAPAARVVIGGSRESVAAYLAERAASITGGINRGSMGATGGADKAIQPPTVEDQRSPLGAPDGDRA